MKINKETWLGIAIVGFLLAFGIDRIAGAVTITVGNPVAFLTSPVLLNTYPFTAAAIAIRSFALFLSVMLIVSLIEGQYIAKIAIISFIGILAEFYSIQQLANGFKMTTIQWTLSIAYGSMLLALGVIIFALRGIWSLFNKKDISTPETSENEEDKSALDP